MTDTPVTPQNLSRFGQNSRNPRVTCTNPTTNLASNAPVGLQLLFTVPVGGCLMTRFHAIPKATVTATGLYLYGTSDGVTYHLIDTANMAAQAIAVGTAPVKTYFGDPSESTPNRLEAGLQLWVGIDKLLAGGIDFKAEMTDFITPVAS